jgi:hypothetical protein
MTTDLSHPVAPLILEAAKRVLAEHASGRSVDLTRLQWAREVESLNPARFPPPLKTAA